MKKNISRSEIAGTSFFLIVEVAGIAQIISTGCISHPRIGTLCGSNAILPFIVLSTLMMIVPTYILIKYLKLRKSNRTAGEI